MSDRPLQSERPPADAKGDTGRAGGGPPAKHGGEAQRVGERETAGIDGDRLRTRLHSVGDARHEIVDTGRVEFTLEHEGGIAALVVALDAQQLGAERISVVRHVSPPSRRDPDAVDGQNTGTVDRSRRVGALGGLPSTRCSMEGRGRAVLTRVRLAGPRLRADPWRRSRWGAGGG